MLAAHLSASSTASDGESSPALDVGDGLLTIPRPESF
jgi:hypothetical protein